MQPARKALAMKPISDAFVTLCSEFDFDHARAVLLHKLIWLNKGKVNTTMVRGNFAIGYGQAAMFADEIGNRGFAERVEQIDGMVLLPPEERQQGWYGTAG
jgi:hypothetical protein